MDVYGENSSSTGHVITKSEEEGILLERGSTDVVAMEMEDVGEVRMVRLTLDEGKGKRPHWYCEKVGYLLIVLKFCSNFKLKFVLKLIVTSEMINKKLTIQLYLSIDKCITVSVQTYIF